MPDPAPRLDRVAIEACPLARALDVVGDRWLLLILREMLYGTTRFEGYREALGVSRAVLSDRLARLVDAGLLQRVPYLEPGRRARHEYQLTRKGAALIPSLVALMDWGARYACDGLPQVELTDAETGERVRVALVLESGARLASLAALRGRVATPPESSDATSPESSDAASQAS